MFYVTCSILLITTLPPPLILQPLWGMSIPGGITPLRWTCRFRGQILWRGGVYWCSWCRRCLHYTLGGGVIQRCPTGYIYFALIIIQQPRLMLYYTPPRPNVVQVSSPYHITTVQSHPERNRSCLSINTASNPSVTLAREIPSPYTVPLLKSAPFHTVIMITLLLGLVLLHLFPSIGVQLVKPCLQVPSH